MLPYCGVAVTSMAQNDAPKWRFMYRLLFIEPFHCAEYYANIPDPYSRSNHLGQLTRE